MNRAPNILFLMSDQQRWDALGCVNPVVKTPNLDELARHGIRFSEAVCNVPMCVPSRYSMMSGLYGSQCGIHHNTQICPDDASLPAPVLPQRLQALGYQTAGFGKTHWYLGSRIKSGIPIKTSRRGFEVRAIPKGADPEEDEPGALMLEADDPETWKIYKQEVSTFGSGQENVHGYTGSTSALDADHYPDGWLTRQALRFLEQERDPDRPLFLFLSFSPPHAGLNVPPGYEDLYRIEDIPDRPLPPWLDTPADHDPANRHPAAVKKAREGGVPTNTQDLVRFGILAEQWQEKSPLERRRTTLRYYALCSFIDDLYGRVLRKLREQGELENTLVLFTSDHGEMLGDRRHRFSKYCLFDGSVRVPLVLSGKGVPVERQGNVDPRPAELVDVLPTLVSAAGGKVDPRLPGRSLLDPPCRLGTFTEIHGSGYEQVQHAPAYLWRTPQWKLILYLTGDLPGAMARVDQVRGELYHLEEDPNEWTNLYGEPAYLAKREELTCQLLMHLACAWAAYPGQAMRARLEA